MTEDGSGTDNDDAGRLGTAPSGSSDASEGKAATGTAESGNDNPITKHNTSDNGNSLSGWWRTVRNPLRIAFNYVIVWLIRLSPSLMAKRWLLRRLGATIGPRVAFGLEATPDVFFPELITIERESIVGYDATILCHEFLQDEYRTGEVKIREQAMIGAGAIILPGVEVGENAQVAANSLVTRDVPPNVTVAGVPASPMGRSDSNGDDRDNRQAKVGGASKYSDGSIGKHDDAIDD